MSTLMRRIASVCAAVAGISLRQGSFSLRKRQGVIFQQPRSLRTRLLIQTFRLLLRFEADLRQRVRALQAHPVGQLVTRSLSPLFKPSSLKDTEQVLSPLTLSLAVIGMGLVFGAALSSMQWLHQSIFIDLPDASDLLARKQIVSTKILDRNGELLYQIYKDENRTVVPLDAIPDSVIYATIAIEDQNFFYHHGFDLKGIARALWQNLNGLPTQGGSTITQQLVKNALLTSDRTLQRKMRELLVAISVDAQYNKEEILELYLNEVSYGGSTYGIEEAAQRYFGKSAAELNLAEASLLAGLPAAPSTYSPFGPHPERAKQRQAQVLKRMTEDGYITHEQAEGALRYPLAFRQDSTAIEAPHFVMLVREELAEMYGEAVVQQGGLVVTTTLDLSLQKQAEAIVSQELETLERLRVSNGAAMITDPQTGEILSMVGSKNYFDFANDGQVNVALRPRQPGSSIKPLTYALALEKGFTPASLILDAPITYQSPGSPPYSPQNYDGQFHGQVTLRDALANSYNVPAVKTLAEVGVQELLDRAPDFGINTWQDRQRFGLSLTLGGGEVTMANMTELYGTFANAGQHLPLQSILKIERFDGELLYESPCYGDQECPGNQALDSRVAAQMSSILSDNLARTPAFGPQSVLYIPGQEVAVKTGTTNNLRDNWTLGYTSNHVVAAWVGNNDNTPMSYVASGVTGASPIWNQLMLLTLNEDEPHVFPDPQGQGLIARTICPQTGTLSCDWCPKPRVEYFIPGTAPTQSCQRLASDAQKIQQSLPSLGL